MIFELENYPILKFIEDNRLKWLNEMLEDSGYDEDGIKSISENFKYFEDKPIQAYFISKSIHKYLLNTNKFINDKILLTDTSEETGIIILPETLYPNFDEVPRYVEIEPNEYPINAIAYSWLAHSNHCIIDGDCDDEDLLNNKDKTLVILPFFNNKITQATSCNHMIDYDESFGTERYHGSGREWYGTVTDYVMSFILANNNRNSYDYLISGDKLNRVSIGFNNSKVEIIY
jgi:hypothetical protein